MSGSMASESELPRDGLDPVLLDRLVDGELAEAERRKLLLSLDHQPSGWRQCALAFLESQSWRSLMGAALQPEPAEEIKSPPVKAEPAAIVAGHEPVIAATAGARRAGGRKWLWVAELAASFLVAFSLGLWIRGGVWTSTTSPTPNFAAIPEIHNGPARNAEAQTVRLIAQGATGNVQQIQIPILDPSRLQSWQSQPEAVVPDAVRRAVEHSGYQIRQERKYFPMQLPNGSRILVPVDQIEVVPAGTQGMQ